MDPAGLVDKHVDLAANAELGQIDARLDGKAGTPEHPAFFACLQAVHVGPVAVRFLADRMTGAMAEVFAVAGLIDDVASGLVDLPTLQGLADCERRLNAGDGGVAPRATIWKIS